MRGDDRITSQRVLRRCFQLEILRRRCSTRSSNEKCTGSVIWMGTTRAKRNHHGAFPVGKPWDSHHISGKRRRKCGGCPGFAVLHWGKLVRFKASTIASSRIHVPPAGSISGVGDARRERPTGRQPEFVHGYGGDQRGRVSGGMVVAE